MSCCNTIQPDSNIVFTLKDKELFQHVESNNTYSEYRDDDNEDPSIEDIQATYKKIF